MDVHNYVVFTGCVLPLPLAFGVGNQRRLYRVNPTPWRWSLEGGGVDGGAVMARDWSAA